MNVSQAHRTVSGVSSTDMFFGGGGGGGQRRNQKKGQDIQAQVGVPLEDLYNGGEVSARISRNVVCRGCSKKPNSKKCHGCGQCPPEIRMVTRQMAPGFNVQMQEEVPSSERCKNEATTLTATVERGMKHEEQVTFERMSEQRPGMIPGDVIFVLKQKDHHQFRREGNDLHLDMHITLKEALVGFTKTFKQLDGRDVPVTSDGVTQPHQVRTIRGEGMPVHNFPSQSGDMHVKFFVDFPTQLSPEQVEQAKQML
jgi:DnaJ-class molecular chaperone